MDRPERTTGSRVLRALGAGLCCAVVGALLAAPGNADTPAELATARSQLKALQSRISQGEAVVAALQAQLESTATGLASGRKRLGDLDVLVTDTRADLAATRAEDAELRSRLDLRAREEFMNGPLNGLNVVFGAASLSDVADSLEVLDRQSRADSSLAREVGRLTEALRQKSARLASLLSRRLGMVRRLADAQAGLTAQFAAQQADLANLAGERAQASALLKRLKSRLAAEELAAATLAAGSGMTITYGEWAGDLLDRLGVPPCQNNLVLVVAWETAEYTQASWNPLATTYPMPGATSFNPVGVRNYRSLDQGLTATAATLSRPGFGYEAVLLDLASCADPMTTGEDVNASQWCRGCAGGTYVTAIIPSVEAFYNSFAGK